MLNKIYRFNEVDQLLLVIKKNCRSTVLIGGCFDILHIGHIKFLRAVKKYKSCLIIILENDAKVKKLKGAGRPFFTQLERAGVLASLSTVNYILLLGDMSKDHDYEKLVVELSPNFIGATENDSLLKIKKVLADKVGAELIIVPKVDMHSTTRIAKLLDID